MVKDFYKLTFAAVPSKDEVIARLNQGLSEFVWVGGESDSSGHFVSGTKHSDGVHIQIWLDYDPPSCTVSFRSAWNDTSDRDQKIDQYYKSIESKLKHCLSL